MYLMSHSVLGAIFKSFCNWVLFPLPSYVHVLNYGLFYFPYICTQNKFKKSAYIHTFCTSICTNGTYVVMWYVYMCTYTHTQCIILALANFCSPMFVTVLLQSWHLNDPKSTANYHHFSVHMYSAFSEMIIIFHKECNILNNMYTVGNTYLRYGNLQIMST